MQDEIRTSGIDIVENVSWGTHICQLYESKDDVYRLMVPFIQAGLKNNELCLWIYCDNTDYDEIRSKLGGYVENVDKLIDEEKLLIMPYKEWYLEDNCFKEVRVNSKWNKIIRCAVDRGFDGLRAVADASWVGKKNYRSFMDYEGNVNRILSELPFLVACLYDVNRLDTFEVADVIRNHSYIITKHEGSFEVIKNMELLIKERQLIESKERYKRLIQLLPDSIFIHDDKKIYYCNKAAYNIISITDLDELPQKPLSDYIAIEKRQQFDEFIKESLTEDKETNYLETELMIKNGQIRQIQIVSSTYVFQGNKALLSVIRDMTPFRKIDQLERDIEEKNELLDLTMEYNKIKTEFFSNISHELRTPINVILSAIQLLKVQSDQISQECKDSRYLKMMQQNCFRLLRLINNLIDITKIEAKYFDLNLQNYDIISLVEAITMSVVDYGRSKGITILFDTDTEEKVIACDPDQIERIMLNLLSNAIKFTPSGGKVLVRIFDQNDHINISVKDTGIGIPPEKQKYIFDRFQQSGNKLTRLREGSGIGLSLVKSLVEKHKGTIELKSKLGKGSEFVVSLPCNTVQVEESKQYTQYTIDENQLVEKINIEFSDIYS